jgi:hypothetical protein
MTTTTIIHHKTIKRYETANPASMTLEEVQKAKEVMLAKADEHTKQAARAKARFKELERAEEALKREEEEKAARKQWQALREHARKVGKSVSELDERDLEAVFGKQEKATTGAAKPPIDEQQIIERAIQSLHERRPATVDEFIIQLNGVLNR